MEQVLGVRHDSQDALGLKGVESGGRYVRKGCSYDGFLHFAEMGLNGVPALSAIGNPCESQDDSRCIRHRVGPVFQVFIGISYDSGVDSLVPQFTKNRLHTFRLIVNGIPGYSTNPLRSLLL
jgi:hypothetical protein